MLRVDGVSVRFGGINALTEVSVEVPGGSVTGLIGPNGAGKTTLFNVVRGPQRPRGGPVLRAAHDIARRAPRGRARGGIARTSRRLEPFGSMTARETVPGPAEPPRRYAGRHVN